jgi:hypothetical protein
MDHMKEWMKQQKAKHRAWNQKRREELVAIYGEARVAEANRFANSTKGVPEDGESPGRILAMGVDVWLKWHNAGRDDNDLIACSICGHVSSKEFSVWSCALKPDAAVVCAKCAADKETMK